MKKLTVMAACAALLLGGGCFLKVNQGNNLLSNQLLNSNLEALTATQEEYLWIGEGTKPVKDQQLQEISRVISKTVIVNGRTHIIEVYFTYRCMPTSNHSCYGALENDTRLYDDMYLGPESKLY